MQATVISINHDEPRIDVRTKGGREFGIDLYREKPELLNTLKVGQVVQVVRKDNSPFVYVTPGKA